MNFNCRISRC